ncbi:hypothetical protein ACHAW6_011359 [Cyclotella cf. meneghiniana]
MANGETRKAIKTSFDKTGQAIAEGAESAADGVKRLTIGIGKGLKDFGKGTVDAILKPQTIPQKLEHCFDVLAVQPVNRTIDFIDESSKSLLDQTDGPIRRRIKEAQRGAQKLKVVFAAPLRPLEFGSFVAKEFPKNDQDKELIEAALEENFVFSHLSESRREILIGAFEPVPYKKGAEIIKEGDVGDYFYVIGAGEVDFTVGGDNVGTAGPGKTFGELALLYQAPRAATCVAKTECGLFRLDQDHFRRILMMQSEDQVHDVIGILKTVPYFKDLDDEDLSKIALNLSISHFKDGDVIYEKGESFCPKFVIVKKGAVKLEDVEAGGSEYKDLTFEEGQFFGDGAIVNNKTFSAKVVAVGDVTILSLNRETFVRVVGSDVQKLVNLAMDKRMLRAIPFGKRRGPAENELDLLASTIKNKKFPKGHVFFIEGQKCNPALYLVRSGRLEIRSSKMAELENLLGFTVTKGDVHVVEEKGYFGNDTLGNNEKGLFGVAEYTVRAIEDVELGVLDLDAIRSVVVMRDQLKESITMKDLDMVRILGAGTFGKVWLVTRKGTQNAYALKVQVKKQLIDYNQAEGVIREKNIMAQLDHPFIIKMVGSWKDENKLYMLLKLYQGGELQSVIHTDHRDGVPECVARFYAANILEGLSYMHRRHIIYRDLKPENVLLDSDGYTVIVDLGFAKVIKDKTYTFCGTPLYLAPEIITQKGHDKGADHWSWGVMLYEMIVGMTPFYDGIVDQMGLFKNIVRGKFDFPAEVSYYAKDLINRMLVVPQYDRLGSFAGAEMDIKRHPFFDGIDWEKLAAKSLKVPFKPTVKNPLDGSNFDDYTKLEAKDKKEKFIALTGREQAMFDKF